MRRSTALVRPAVVGGTTLALAGLVSPFATAASADLEYSCEYGVDTTEGTGDATASWDSGIADGLVVEVGDSVSLDPYTGTVELPTGFVDALRDSGRTELGGGGLQLTVLEESDEPFIIELVFDSTPVPASGPMTLDLSGVDPEDIEATEAGTYTLVANDFFLSDDDDTAGMYCELVDNGDATIDSFTAQAAPGPTVTVTPTPTVTVTASPVRPVLVQTDAAGAGPSLLPAAAGAGLLVLAGGVAARRRLPDRRH
ncbi:hypothetical protein JQN72_15060 [Phycicoccus sp. CSK15P-2]|uniref:DUF6801 domain-containing protein n=1 Tax=Phycicoccus sp. CSK15P-2 TaxID=2807627 RepID=UPI001951F234|nr:DUF6801 domain-containing protein [Phycicoccus sp. CSK15P-2]MBM6405563.1 hypothetical protein [Phycicoccus sp. CSK15P-2]